MIAPVIFLAVALGRCISRGLGAVKRWPRPITSCSGQAGPGVFSLAQRRAVSAISRSVAATRPFTESAG